MFYRIRKAALCALMLAPLWAGAGRAEAPVVVTDIAPVQSLVARVMQGVGVPGVLVRPGASPHGYALRPSEAGALQEAGAVFWVGPALTPWLDGAIGTLAGQAEVTPLLTAPGITALPLRRAAHFAPHGDHGHDHDDGHAAGGVDPHAWLDPGNAALWLDLIAERLGHIDPSNAALYLENADAGQAELAALTAEIERTLAPVKETPFMVLHDSLHYFEDRFGLAAIGAIAPSDAADPGPARIDEVRRLVRDQGVVCVLAEPQLNAAPVRTVVEGTGARMGRIDPMGTEIAPGAGFYSALLRAMAADLRECLD